MGATLIDAPVSHLTSVCKGLGTLFFLVGLSGEMEIEIKGIFLSEDWRAVIGKLK